MSIESRLSSLSPDPQERLVDLTNEALTARRADAIAEAKRIAENGVKHNRDLTEGEHRRFTEEIEVVEAIDRIAAQRNGSAAHELSTSFRSVTGREPSGGPARGRYGVSDASLRSHFDALTNGGTASTREEFRAALTTSVMGAAASWGSKAAAPATSLREFAGISVRPLDGMSASHPSVTLPTGAAGVGEGVANTEITGVALSTLTTARYGAYTQVSAAVKTFDDLSAVAAAQQVHIARSLTSADVTAIDAQAGTPVVYASATFEASLRAAVLGVAATAGVDVSECVIYGQAAALSIANGFQPTNGGDRGSFAERIYGARVFPILSGTANRVTVFAPAAFLAFESQLGAATLVQPTDGSTTFGTWLHATPAGPAIVGAAKALATV